MPAVSYLGPTEYIESDHPEVVAFARRAAAGAESDRQRAVRLYYAVRDGIRYDPWLFSLDPEVFRASTTLASGTGFCIPKAILLAAAARALGVAHVPPVAEPVELLEVTGTAPVSGNLDGTTAGFFQLDRISDGDEVEESNHDNASLGTEGAEQAIHFFMTWLESGTPEIIDPYAVLGTPPLP